MHNTRRREWRALGGVMLGVVLTASPLLAQQPAARQGAPTFSKDVAPILYKSCVKCHHAGSIGPMSLMTYAEARPWAKSIGNKVGKREMPPWYIDRHVGVTKFIDDPSLTDDQVNTIVKWVEAGAPQGNPADTPPAPKFSGLDDLWAFKPDMIVPLDKDIVVAARGPDHWLDIVVDPHLTEDRWLQAIETKPSKGQRVIHHAVTSMVSEDDGDRLSGGQLNEYALGKNADLFPEGTARLIKAGAKINFNLHTHAIGEDTPANVQLALKFYPRGYKPEHVIEIVTVAGSPLDIPPNTDNVRADSYMTLLRPTRVLSFQPHMHNRGKAMCVEAILPGNGQGSIRSGNEVVPISCVDRYQFAWHIAYHFAEDVQPLLPAGTILHVTAWHNNTASNRFNPDPDQHVTFGNRTVDDMGFAWMKWIALTDEEFAAATAARKAQRADSN